MDAVRSDRPNPSQRYNLALCMLASGSKGNAIFISDGATSILVDAGLSGREIERRLRSKGIDPASLSAIVLSHEHSDHTRSVGVLSRRYDLPVYVNPATLKAAAAQLGRLKKVETFNCGAAFHIDRLQVHPFSISHDAIDPAGFTVACNGTKIGIATDLGIATAMVKTHLKGCSLVILEANHDPAMLIEGPYPWHLKQRIKGRSGHLSNQDARMLLDEIKHDRLEQVILAHLSEINNTPAKARRSVGQALDQGLTRLDVARQDRCGKMIYLG